MRNMAGTRSCISWPLQLASDWAPGPHAGVADHQETAGLRWPPLPPRICGKGCCVYFCVISLTMPSAEASLLLRLSSHINLVQVPGLELRLPSSMGNITFEPVFLSKEELQRTWVCYVCARIDDCIPLIVIVFVQQASRRSYSPLSGHLCCTPMHLVCETFMTEDTPEQCSCCATCRG